MFFVIGTVRVGTVDYLIDSMNFSIDAGSVIVPDTSGSRNATLNAGRFLFRGMITGTSEAGVTRVFDLTGSGRTSINFGNNEWFQTNYDFGNTAAVPEPGTFLLLGSGALALIRRKPRTQN